MQPDGVARKTERKPHVPPKRFAPADVAAGIVWGGIVVIGIVRMVSYLFTR